MTEIAISAATLADVRAPLGRGRTAVEDTAGSAPGSVDAGEASAVLNSMVSRALERAAAVSEAIAVVDDRVGSAGADFFETDGEVAGSMPGVRGGD